MIATNYPFVVPSVYRVHCTPDAPIDVSLNGAIKANDMKSNPLVFIMNGDCAFLFAKGNYIAILRVKSDGSWCWYSNCTFAQFISALNGVIELVHFVGDSLVQVFSYNGATRYSTWIPFPIHFQAGAWIQIPTKAFTFPPCPCGGGQSLDTVYYDADRNLMLCTYSKNFPNDYDLWAGVYQVSYSNYGVVNQGYVGTFPNGTNPIYSQSDFSRVYNGISYGVASGEFSYTQNGAFVGRNIQFTDKLGKFVAAGSMRIIPGNLDCSGLSSDLPTGKLTLNSVLDTQNVAFNGTNFKNNYSNLCHGACDLPGVIPIANVYSALDLYNGTDKFFELYNLSTPFYYSSLSAFIGGRVYNLVSKYNQGNIPPYNAQIIISTPDTSILPFGPPPSVSGMTATSVLNWHRPISINGEYKT